jgi:hypothetical protein
MAKLRLVTYAAPRPVRPPPPFGGVIRLPQWHHCLLSLLSRRRLLPLVDHSSLRCLWRQPQLAVEEEILICCSPLRSSFVAVAGWLSLRLPCHFPDRLVSKPIVGDNGTVADQRLQQVLFALRELLTGSRERMGVEKNWVEGGEMERTRWQKWNDFANDLSLTYMKGKWCPYIGTIPPNIVSTFHHLSQDYT